jgi:hypothetical protein
LHGEARLHHRPPGKPPISSADEAIVKPCCVCGEAFIQRSNRQKACRGCRAATPGHQPLGTVRVPDPICVDCGQPYALRGPVSQVMRCEPCQTKRVDPEHPDRLRRIAAAAPPVSSFEGRVQRWRDEHAEEFETVWSGDEWRRRVPVPPIADREYPA